MRISSVDTEQNVIYKDPSVTVSERVKDLISRMTPEEKIGQMTQLDITLINKTGKQKDVELEPSKARKYIIEHHIGSFLNGEAASRKQWFDYSYELQKIAVEESRLGIPIIYGIDHMHGASYLKDATIFPHNINLAATFDPRHVSNAAEVTVHESANLGHHWIFAPVLDLGRNPKWPRFYETYGESAYLAAQLGKTFVERLQNSRGNDKNSVAATAKHFLGYSDPKSGWDRTPVDLSDQTIHEFHLPSFKAAIDAGLKTVMLNSGEVNGIPVHASHRIIKDLLREELGFDGVVVTDWDDIGKLVNHHYTAENFTEAVYQSVSAGIDMSMTPLSLKFNSSMTELLRSGKITEDRIDESVRRILRLKFELGLFEHPYPEYDSAEDQATEINRSKATNAARESLVLLKNDGSLLPLKNESQKILLLGPVADSKRDLSGGWTISWQGGNDENYPEYVKTIRQAITEALPDAEIISPKDWKDSNEITRLAKSADLVITAIGEEPYTEFVGNLTDLALPADQVSMLNSLIHTGKPLISVYAGGRPRIMNNVIDGIDAFVWAGLPGFEGAEAIANLISGAFNPVGRLPFSYPKYSGHFVPYNHKPSDIYHYDPEQANLIIQDDADEEMIWEWPFGSGLSYTTYEFSELYVSKEQVTADDTLTASIKISNTGKRAGEVPVLWYIKDHVGSFTRPVRELKHFGRIFLEPGESRMMSFTIIPERDLSFPDPDGINLLEEGDFTVSAGGIETTFRLIKPG